MNLRRAVLPLISLIAVAYVAAHSPALAWIGRGLGHRVGRCYFSCGGWIAGRPVDMLAAWLLLARVGGGLPSTGTGLAMQGIGAAVIGGVPITGGKGSIVGTFFVKERLGLSAEFLAALGFWAGLPWALKVPLGHLVDLIWRWKAALCFVGAGLIAAAARTYKIYYRKVPTEGQDYTMDHSATLFLMDSKGEFYGTSNFQEPEETRRSKLRQLLKNG